MVLNASRLMIADLLESERTAISIDCETKMAKLIDISRKVGELATYNYKKDTFKSNAKHVPFSTLSDIVNPANNSMIAALKLGPFPGNEPAEEKSFITSRVASSE